MTKWPLIALFSVALIAAGKPTQEDVSAELKKLQGTWRLVDEFDDGIRTPAGEAGKDKLIFEVTGKWKVESDGKVVGEGTATLDPTKRPKTIDYVLTVGAAAGTKFVAIYELDGDSFRHCGVLKGNRPTEFSSKPGSGQILTMFRREKKE
ncbi:MAG TPA: TIGR03067 domain-containing protein [Blastocatellia bacterium]|nr:TIGR03067 domain-containing protein [Blastocatellia bacterium]